VLLIYTNANGNPAISKKVLDAFHALSGSTVVWENGWKGWRLRRQSDLEGRRRAE
jgi:hypothetical protein